MKFAGNMGGGILSFKMSIEYFQQRGERRVFEHAMELLNFVSFIYKICS